MRFMFGPFKGLQGNICVSESESCPPPNSVLMQAWQAQCFLLHIFLGWGALLFESGWELAEGESGFKTI